MQRRFVIEAVMVAIYGELIVPSQPVEYVVPYSSIMELYELQSSSEPIMNNSDDDAHARAKIAELIRFFEDTLNKKKIERALMAPWRQSPPIPASDKVSFTVVNAVDNAQYGEYFDPVETELLLTAMNENIPILTDQLEFVDKVIEADVPVQVYDIDDFEFAVEGGITQEI
jgi:hypothetical protein